MRIKNAARVSVCLIAIPITIFLIWLAIPPPRAMLSITGQTSVIFTDSSGIPLREKPGEGFRKRTWVPIGDMSPHIVTATISAEDRSFYFHHGVDLRATFRAAYLNIRYRRVVSGGSTITQQLARNLAPSDRTYIAKIREALLALKLETHLSKQQILEQYLNRIPYGNGAYGIEAASRRYFDKPARDITLAEAALLATLPRAPSYYNPVTHPARVLDRRDTILRLMLKYGAISKSEYASALREKISPAIHSPEFAAPHFSDYVLAVADPQLVRDSTEVRTTLDLSLQKSIERIVRGHIGSLSRENVTNAAVVVIDNQSGGILAMVGSVSYGDRQRSGMVNGALARRQPGSALKPFTYSLALRHGYTAATIIPDVRTHFTTGDGDYVPINYDRTFRGPVRLRMALANSMNVPAVHTAMRLGPPSIVDFLKQLDFASIDKSPSYYGLGVTLGNGEVSLLELTRAYTVFPNAGVLKPLTAVRYYATGSRKNIPVPASGRRVIDESTAYIISDILSDRNARFPVFGRYGPLSLPFRCAAKTGTSSNYRDNWTVGFTREVTVGVWVGNFNGEPMKNISGVTGAGPIFRDAMKAAMEQRSNVWMQAPQNITRVRICPMSGMRAGKHCSGSIEEIFVKGTEPKMECDWHRILRIDTRTGMLAGKRCPQVSTIDRTMVSYPPVYWEWAGESGIPIAPESYSPLCTDAGARIGPVEIIYPRDGDSFRIDYSVPPQYRSIVLRAAASQGADRITWRIDGKTRAVVATPFSWTMPLVPGRHSIEALSGKHSDLIYINIE